MSHQFDDLPAPPPSPEVVERKTLPHKRNLLVPLVLVSVLGGILYTGCASQEVVVKPKPSPAAPVTNANPCGHETFSKEECAARIIMISAQQLEATPQEIIDAFCKGYSTPRAQARLVDKWVSQGAYPKEARAVIDQILSHCR